MDLADELFDNSPIGSRQEEQAVIICLHFPIGKFEKQRAVDAIVDLDDILRTVVETSGVGTYHGHKFYQGPEEESVTFYIHGEDASRIYQEIKPIMQSLPFHPGSYILKRYSQFKQDHHSLRS